MSVHERRLQAEFEAMQAFRSHVMSWEVANGSSPPNSYIVTFRLRSIVGFVDGEATYQDLHKVSVELPPEYPRSPPVVSITSKPLVLHPNVYSNGRVCIEDRWKPVGMYLDSICEHVGKIIAYQIINTESPANRDSRVLAWVSANRNNARLIPTDGRQIRLPAAADMIVWGQADDSPPPRIQW